MAFGMQSTASVGYAWAYLKATLLRLNARIAAWSSGRWNHRHAAAAHRRHHDAGIGAGGWTDHAFGCGELIAQRSAPCGFAGAWCSAATRQATILIRRLRQRRRSSGPLRLGVCDGDKWRCDGRDDGRNVHGSHVMSPQLMEDNARRGIIVPPVQPGGTSIVMRAQQIGRKGVALNRSCFQCGTAENAHDIQCEARQCRLQSNSTETAAKSRTTKSRTTKSRTTQTRRIVGRSS